MTKVRVTPSPSLRTEKKGSQGRTTDMQGVLVVVMVDGRSTEERQETKERGECGGE